MSNFSSLNRFLQATKKWKQSGRKLRLVLGNESGDLDSIVCALAYAYWQDKDVSAGRPLHIPLLQFSSQDFSLRTDALHLLGAVLGVDLDALTFLDQIDEFFEADGDIVLVDHNVLSADIEQRLHASNKGALAVVEIIDHHLDQHFYKDTVRTRCIEMVGSASSLIAEQTVLRQNNSDNDDNDNDNDRIALATMLLAPVLLDTANLSETVGRATEKDRLVAKQLAAVARLDDGGTALYHELQAKKFDNSGLSTRDLLRKDYKQWTMGADNTIVGIAATVVPLDELLRRDQPTLTESMQLFAGERQLGALLVMTMHVDADNDGNFARQLVVLAPTDLHAKLVNYLLEDTELQLEPFADAPTNERVSFWHQRNVKHSRKQVQPYVANFFE